MNFGEGFFKKKKKKVSSSGKTEVKDCSRLVEHVTLRILTHRKEGKIKKRKKKHTRRNKIEIIGEVKYGVWISVSNFLKVPNFDGCTLTV